MKLNTKTRRLLAAAGISLAAGSFNASAQEVPLPLPVDPFSLRFLGLTAPNLPLHAVPAHITLYENLIKVIRAGHYAKDRVDALNDLIDQNRSAVALKTKTPAEALNEILGKLDPHSRVVTTKEVPNLRTEMSGWRATGMDLQMSDKGAEVYSVSYKSMARKAGILEGDVIISVNGEALAGLSPDKAAELMCGAARKKLRVVVNRKDAPMPVSVDVTCEFQRAHSVHARVIEHNIGYVRVDRFTDGSYIDVNAVLSEMENTKQYKITGYILDFRNNPGGFVNDAYGIMDDVLDTDQPMMRTLGRDGDRPVNAKLGDITKGKPIIVLVNGGAFSASEMVASALQHFKRARIYGTNTGGKGSMQQHMYFDDAGNLTGFGQTSTVMLAYTSNIYMTPDGKSAQLDGVVVDVEVPGTYIAPDAPQPERDSPNALPNPNGRLNDFSERLRPVHQCVPDSSTQQWLSHLKAPDGTADLALMCAVKDLIPSVNIVKTVPVAGMPEKQKLRASAVHP